MAEKQRSLTFSWRKEDKDFPCTPAPDELLEKLPLLPVEEEVILEQAFNFYRVVLQKERNLVFLSSPSLVSFLRNFLRGKTGSKEKRFIGFVDSSEEDLLLRWSKILPPKDTTLVVLARPLEELQLLLLAFSLPQWKKVLVGSNYGILAQSARALFFPFFPTEIYHHHFWQRSALLYLPLICLDLPVRELEEGFKDGDYLREEAVTLSLFLQEKGERVIFLVDNSFILSILQSFIPLLEYSCRGEQKIEFRAGNFSAIRDNQLFLSSGSVFILVKKGLKNIELRFTIPSPLHEMELFSGEGLVPVSGSWGELREAEYRVVEDLLQREEKDFLKLEYHLPDLQTAGELMVFLRYFVLYNAFWRGLDLWSDPAVVEFDSQVWKLFPFDKR